jgi:8-oxo-dGTP diphosphatase
MLLVVAGLVYRGEELLIAQRPDGKHSALKWEFPGGKVEENEDPRDTLVREIKEELDIEVKVQRIADVIFHRYPDRAVLLLFYVCQYASGVANALDAADFAWVKPEQLMDYDFIAADTDLIQQLALGKRY